MVILVVGSRNREYSECAHKAHLKYAILNRIESKGKLELLAQKGLSFTEPHVCEWATTVANDAVWKYVSKHFY